jgi:succinate dehydrogenase/fumarate reductase flavoprotein subunit
MKITLSQLKQIIKEEIQRSLDEGDVAGLYSVNFSGRVEPWNSNEKTTEAGQGWPMVMEKHLKADGQKDYKKIVADMQKMFQDKVEKTDELILYKDMTMKVVSQLD